MSVQFHNPVQLFPTVPDGSEVDWDRMPLGPGDWEKEESNVPSLPAIEPRFSGHPYCFFVCTDLFLVTLEFTAQTTELVTINRRGNPFDRRLSF